MTAETIAKISDFTRDAEVRIGHLTYLINSLRDEGSLDYQDAYQQRKALMDFYEILNDRYAVPFKDDTSIVTLLIAPPNGNMDTTKYPSWTEREIVDEIDWLRYYGQLSYTTGSSAGYYTASIVVNVVISALIHLQGTWDPNTNSPFLQDTAVGPEGYYYLVINADDGVLFQDAGLYGNRPIVFFTDDVVLSTGTRWIVLRGSRFVPVIERQADTSPSGQVLLDLGDFGQVNVHGSANIAEAKTWSLTNTTGNRKFSFKFTLTGSPWVQTFPASFKMSDVRWDPVAKTWSPVDIGEYLAEGILAGGEWMVQITGPYV